MYICNIMKILFLIYHGFSEHSGISKKIKYQIKGLRDLGHEVYVCYYDYDKDGNKVRYIDGKVVKNYGHSLLSPIRQRTDFVAIADFAVHHHIDFVYARHYTNANPFIINLFKTFRKNGIKSVIEIPTYPYDKEYDGLPLKYRLELIVDKMFRQRLAQQTNRIVTFTDELSIFGQKTCCISNGIDFDSVPVRTSHPRKEHRIDFIGVAEVHYWHGFDRFIHGIGEYYKNGGTMELYFHIVGGIADREMHDSKFARGFQDLANEYHIQDRIIYHGQLFGEELDKVFNQCDFAVGSLARHRSNIDKIKTLKNREYAARGIPFIYSETDEDFDNKPYIIKAPADESAVKIEEVIRFYTNLDVTPQEIRESISDLSWKKQMEKVINHVFNS